MQTVTFITALRDYISRWKQHGEAVCLVPTMGNLHEGHLRLIEESKLYAERTVVSIFVNPLQFGPTEDFLAYPRTLDADSRLLADCNADVLFAPPAADMYPRPLVETTFVEVPKLSDILCGAFRPGHFRGVTTVVNKLFNVVQPEVAIFGEKDFQQLTIIRRMVADLELPIKIVGLPTVRAADGLALSSRNAYLSAEERALAPQLYAVLTELRNELLQGVTGYRQAADQAEEKLRTLGFFPDYISIRRASDLAEPEIKDRHLVILAAAYLGKTRLIDNVQVSLNPKL